MDEKQILNEIKFVNDLIQWCMESIELIIPEIHKFEALYKGDAVKIAEEIRRTISSGKLDYSSIGIKEGDR